MSITVVFCFPQVHSKKAQSTCKPKGYHFFSVLSYSFQMTKRKMPWAAEECWVALGDSSCAMCWKMHPVCPAQFQYQLFSLGKWGRSCASTRAGLILSLSSSLLNYVELWFLNNSSRLWQFQRQCFAPHRSSEKYCSSQWWIMDYCDYSVCTIIHSWDDVKDKKI